MILRVINVKKHKREYTFKEMSIFKKAFYRKLYYTKILVLTGTTKNFIFKNVDAWMKYIVFIVPKILVLDKRILGTCKNFNFH